jgi:LAO/AO transport system kinase
MKTPELKYFIEGIEGKNRVVLARAITLVESEHPDHQKLAQELIAYFLPKSGKSKRLGISGTPGVGKSTFIEAFGKMLTSQNKQVAVLAIDPTSQVSGGSILGDKTRMNELSIDPLAFIRPSPSGKTLGGVARRTRESMLLCEAFGFDYILVETVGVGQSETTVSEMVDMFIMLLQPGSGDDLQGIKRGILELVDMVVVTKDDGSNRELIAKARHDYKQALHILRHQGWNPPVLSCSAVTKTGLPDVQQKIDEYYQSQKTEIDDKRSKQGINWMWQLVFDGLKDEFHQLVPSHIINKIQNEVTHSQKTSVQASNELLSEFKKNLEKTI